MLLEALKWFATGTTVLAAVMMSLDLGRKVTGSAFVVFTASSIAWIAAGFLETEPSIATQNVVLLGVNLVGIWRWLLRPLA